MSEILSAARPFKRPQSRELRPGSTLLARWMLISLVAALLGAIPIVALYHLHEVPHILRVFFFTSVCSTIMTALVGGTLIRFGAWMYSKPIPLNWVLLCGATLAGTSVGSLLADLIFLAVHNLPDRDFWSSFWLMNQVADIFGLIFGISGFTYEMLRNRLAARQVEEERARKRALEAQLASLESRVRPHFLFNALNTISSLIVDNPKLAEALIGKLAALLRFSLDAPANGLVPLGRELKMVHDYLEIESARFGRRLRQSIHVPAVLCAAEVPAFCLQTLVENSVKHAVAMSEEGAAICVTASAADGCMRIEVTDDGPGFTADAIRPGHGLDTLRSRLAALYGPAGKLTVDGRGSVLIEFPQ